LNAGFDTDNLHRPTVKMTHAVVVLVEIESKIRKRFIILWDMDASAETKRGQPNPSQAGVKLGSSWGQGGVKVGSRWGQAGVKLGSTCTALPRAGVTCAGRREGGEDHVKVRVAWRQAPKRSGAS